MAHREEQQFHQQKATKSIIVNWTDEYSNFSVVSGNSTSGNSVNNNKKVWVLEVFYENKILLEDEEASPPKHQKKSAHLGK